MTGFVKSALNLFGIKSEGELGEGGPSIEEFLNTLPDLLGFDISFKYQEKKEVGAHYEIEGPDAQDFLKSNSNVLESLSHLCMRILRKQAGLQNKAVGEEIDLRNFRVTFDSQGFREAKILDLKEMAEKARQKVIDAGGKPSYIPAHSPSERKVIHTHLADLGEVTSESIGKGTFKRIRVKLLPDSQHKRAQPESSRGGQRGGPKRRGGGAPGKSNNSRRGGPRGGRGNNQKQGDFVYQVDPFADDPVKEVNGNVAVPDKPQKEVDDDIGNRADPNEDNYGNR